MRELDWDKIYTYAALLAFCVLLVPILTRLPRSRGKNVIFHVLYLAFAIACLLLIPGDIQDDMFSPGGVIVIGTLLPVYESIAAVCTPGSDDDAVWVQYWIASGTLSYCTEFIDEIRHHFPSGGEHWYEFEFFFTLWLMLPFTDGATLLHELITEPYVAPVARKIKDKVEGWIALILTIVNTSHLFFAWFLFMSFPEEQRRFFVVAIGTVYPLSASMISITTRDDGDDETFWLTYWSCFSLLFLAMDYLENFVGHIPGFYSVCLVATIYLFLPIFDGANVIFRRVLVPLSGQYENLCMLDAYKVRKSMEKSLPPTTRNKVCQKAAAIFAASKED